MEAQEEGNEAALGDRILDAAQVHFARQMQGDPIIVEIPEWKVDGESTKLYFWPATLKERDQIFQTMQKGTLESIAQTIVTRARNKDKALLFKKAHIFYLMNKCPADILTRITDELAAQEGLAAMLANQQAREEGLKNS